MPNASLKPGIPKPRAQVSSLQMQNNAIFILSSQPKAGHRLQQAWAGQKSRGSISHSSAHAPTRDVHQPCHETPAPVGTEANPAAPTPCSVFTITGRGGFVHSTDTPGSARLSSEDPFPADTAHLKGFFNLKRELCIKNTNPFSEVLMKANGCFLCCTDLTRNSQPTP